MRVLMEAAVEEAARLLGADGGSIYLLSPEGASLRLMFDPARPGARGSSWRHGLRLAPGSGLFGRAIEAGVVVSTGDYAADLSFTHTVNADRLVAGRGIRSMVVAPLVADGEALGALGVFSRRTDAFSAGDEALVGALAAHAAITVANARLIEQLASSRAALTDRVESERSLRDDLERRGRRERALRQLVADLAAIRDPDVLLQRVVEEAATIAGAKGAFLDTVSTSGAIRSGYVEGVPERVQELLARMELPRGEGLMGRALEERRTLVTGDYLTDPAFGHVPDSDELAARVGIRSLIAAPLVAFGGAVGVLATYSDQQEAFDEDDVALISAFADHAAIAIANAGLIEDLARSREEAARRATTEHGLREIAGRLATFRELGDLLQYAVDEAARLAEGDWAVMALVREDGTLDWSHYASVTSPAVRSLHDAIRLRIGEGILGRAVADRRPRVTGDYLVDEGFTHDDAVDAFADAAGFRSVVAAPLITDAGVLGVLGVHAARTDAFDEDDVALISAFADHAAVAITNVRLYERVQTSESRYRQLLESSPDIVFRVDADGTFTFVSETVERLLGWAPGEIVGRHFGAVIDVGSMGDALERWRDLRVSPGEVLSARFLLIHRDGPRIPFEVRSSGQFADGRFIGVQGSARDVSERERLERELRGSEERYREIVAASPDLIWETDADGVFTFVSATIRSLIGSEPEEIVGRHFATVLHPDTAAEAFAAWARLAADPTRVQPARFSLSARDGSAVPVENFAIARMEGGRFIGAHGAARDVRERERLERELRASEAQYRYLVENSPDIVWSAGADGILTYISETSERVLGWRPNELVGKHFANVIHPESRAYVQSQYAASLGGADARDLRYPFLGLHRDGTAVPLEMHGRTIVEDGRYLGTHGAVRDVRERERLERSLRRQAAELAANEERGRLARELHDSVTQALFSMTLVTRSIEVLMDRDPDEARRRIPILHELQRDALAEMRALIFELRPASLETEGLARALQTHAAAVQGRTGLPIAVEADESERLPAEVEATLFRIAQEALHNVVKHARAQQVRIAVEREQERVRLVVEDDGAGFDPDAVSGNGHLGLAGMRTRAEKVGGVVRIESARGRGTTLRAELPLVAHP